MHWLIFGGIVLFILAIWFHVYIALSCYKDWRTIKLSDIISIENPIGDNLSILMTIILFPFFGLFGFALLIVLLLNWLIFSRIKDITLGEFVNKFRRNKNG